MHSDIAEALVEGSMATLIMHDLSAAYNVIDRPIILKHLEFSFGIKEKALTWIKSYLGDRTNCVSFEYKTSPYKRRVILTIKLVNEHTIFHNEYSLLK